MTSHKEHASLPLQTPSAGLLPSCAPRTVLTVGLPALGCPAVLNIISLALALSPLADLRSTLTSSSDDGPPALHPNTTVPLHTGTPHIVAVTRDDSRILVVFTNGSISVYDWSTPGPLFTFPSPSGTPVKDIFPSTGDSEIVAVLREPGDALTVELLDVQKLVSVGGWNAGGSPETKATAGEYYSPPSRSVRSTC